MGDRVSKYIIDCFHMVPTCVSVGLLITFCLGTIFLFAFWGYEKGFRWSARLLLVEFLFWLISLTVLFRSPLKSRLIKLIPFWSYRALKGWGDILLTQAIMNVVAFIPVGVLTGCSFGKMKWWKVILFSAAFTILIEALQYIFNRGFAEFDDVFHNVVGAMIGYGMYVGLRWLIKRAQRERVVGV